ncbi:MAG: hypothetical protein WCO68_11180 [Verrucomicrobiota bacterium]
MKVGSHYRIHDIRRGDWEKLARELKLPAGKIGERINAAAEQIAAVVVPVASSIENEGIAHPVVGLLSKSLASHVEACLQQLDKPPGRS